MDEEEYKECLKMLVSGSSEDESDSGSKSQLDDVYESFKPSPILIDPQIHKIIEIGTFSSQVVSSSTKKLTKSQRKRRRNKKNQNVKTSSTDNGTGPETFGASVKVNNEAVKSAEAADCEYKVKTSRRKRKKKGTKTEDVEKELQKSTSTTETKMSYGESEETTRCEYRIKTSRKEEYGSKKKQENTNIDNSHKEAQSCVNVFFDVSSVLENKEFETVIDCSDSLTGLKCEYKDYTSRNKTHRGEKKLETNNRDERAEEVQQSSGILTRSGLITYVEKHSVGLEIISCLAQNAEAMDYIKNKLKTNDKKAIEVMDTIKKKTERINSKNKTQNSSKEMTKKHETSNKTLGNMICFDDFGHFISKLN
ncbi:uncharacterized protein LOC135134163 [Zophobas morio]|uniref:uncharacterized protein LOC135134163 n=1 Tax=Zophobas morio TaxID=2755281 RepID=UPI003083087F